MNRYPNRSPRAAFALAALVMSVLTMGALVAAPATVGTRSGTEVAISPGTIEVVGVRARSVALAGVSLPHVD